MTIVEREPQTEPLTERERRARLLEAAALEIEVCGWTKGTPGMIARQGPYCILGAINASDTDSYGSSYYAASLVWWGNDDDPCGDILLWGFNDQRAQSADEVAGLLRWRAQEIRDGR